MIENIIMPKFEPKGLIKIELFDELTGTKNREVNTHNFIAKGVLDTIFKAKMRDVFTDFRATGKMTVSSWFEDAFAQISLTTADHAELPETEWLREGELVGYAYSDATYSGPDVLRGGYNEAESFTKPDLVRMVFDFPTNAANGTFGSVYFHPKTSAYRTPNIIDSKLTNLKSIQKYNDKYYMLKADKLEVYSADWVLINTFTIPSGTNLKDFCIVNDKIYYVRDSSSDTIIKADLNSPSNTTRVINMNSSNVGGICFDESNQRFIVADYLGEVTTLIYYDVNFVEVSRVVMTGAGSNYNEGVLNIEGNNLTFGRFGAVNFKDGLLISTLPIRGMNDNTLYMANYALPKTFIGSRSLLDTAITKTNKQTMKITYDFVLPPM